MKSIVIGIAGGSASGKSSVASRLKDHFGTSKSVLILRQDDYYLNQPELSFEMRVKVNYDHPLAFDYDLLLKQLNELKAGQAVNTPVYDYKNYLRSEITELVEPAEVIIIEGLFVLAQSELRAELDIKVFIEADADIRFIRRLVRDVKERQRSLDSVVEQYITTVKPMHEQFVQPSKIYADIIIPHGVENIVALDLLTTKISSIITQNNNY